MFCAKKTYRSILGKSYFFFGIKVIKAFTPTLFQQVFKNFFSGYFGIFSMKILLRFSCFQVGEKTFQNILNYILKTSVVCIGIVWCPELIKTCFFFILTIGISDECHPWYFVDIKRGSSQSSYAMQPTISLGSYTGPLCDIYHYSRGV